MSQRTIAIGDIHGCALALRALLNAIDPQPRDIIVTLGDYVDRGNESKMVIETLMTLRDQCHYVPLMGNHEIMLLTAYAQRSELPFWLECGGQATVASYGKSIDDIPESHLEFMNSCQPHFETVNHFYIHANYQPDQPLQKQPPYTRYWEHLAVYIPGPHVSGKTGVVGHTPQVSGEPLDLGYLVCLDTYCVGGKWLTAMDMASGTIWQADRRGKLRATTAEQ